MKSYILRNKILKFNLDGKETKSMVFNSFIQNIKRRIKPHCSIGFRYNILYKDICNAFSEFLHKLMWTDEITIMVYVIY